MKSKCFLSASYWLTGFDKLPAAPTYKYVGTYISHTNAHAKVQPQSLYGR